MTKKEQLEQLEQRNDELLPIVTANHQTSKEIDAHRKAIKAENEEFHGNLLIIWKLRWELMTHEEQANKIILVRKKLKRHGVKDPAEIEDIIQKKIKEQGWL